jgi:hypothetical protein
MTCSVCKQTSRAVAASGHLGIVSCFRRGYGRIRLEEASRAVNVPDVPRLLVGWQDADRIAAQLVILFDMGLQLYKGDVWGSNVAPTPCITSQ